MSVITIFVLLRFLSHFLISKLKRMRTSINAIGLPKLYVLQRGVFRMSFALKDVHLKINYGKLWIRA